MSYFEWDPKKNRDNWRKHGLSFDEAAELFTSGSDFLEIYDAVHSYDEDRFIAIGAIRSGIIVVVFTEALEDVIRVVSARRATRSEFGHFRQYQGSSHE